MTEARTITLTLTAGQYNALARAAFEGADSPDLAAARDALEQAWADAAPGFPIVPPGQIAAEVAADWRRLTHPPGWDDLIGPDPER